MDTTNLTKEALAKTLDFSILQAWETEEDIRKHCELSKELNVAIVAINSVWTKFCVDYLKDTDVKVGASVGFPLGQMSIKSKLDECQNAIDDGAQEIDYVCNVGRARMHDWDYIRDEMQQMVDLCKKHNVLVKVIFENCYLEKEEIRQLSLIAKDVKPDYIKTNTGFGSAGAQVEDVQLMYETVQGAVKVKAAGKVRTWQDAKMMLEAGAERIGTTGAVPILEGFEKEHK
ncbi:MAG: deoxyribose-phosphate aldolase [Erysipelotrichaceae bacterium]|nr:deoxyribose-phosphate aldolase [Erysipelotrichaceae bacterium]